MELHHNPLFSVLELFLTISRTKDGKHGAVNSDRSLYYIRYVALVKFRVKVLYLPSAEFLMAAKVKVRS